MDQAVVDVAEDTVAFGSIDNGLRHQATAVDYLGSLPRLVGILIAKAHFLIIINNKVLSFKLFCKSPESCCCERGLASAGGDVLVPLQIS